MRVLSIAALVLCAFSSTSFGLKSNGGRVPAAGLARSHTNQAVGPAVLYAPASSAIRRRRLNSNSMVARGSDGNNGEPGKDGEPGMPGQKGQPGSLSSDDLAQLAKAKSEKSEAGNSAGEASTHAGSGSDGSHGSFLGGLPFSIPIGH